MLKKLKEKNIYGVQFRSRKDPEGDCLVFYDNLPHIPRIKNNFIGCGLSGFFREFQAVSNEIGNFLDRRLLVVVRQDHRVLLFL